MEYKLEHNPDYWAWGLVRQLLKTLHQQWFYCNATVHMKLKDSMIASQHKAILGRIEDYLNPSVLLEENRDLLCADFQWLATSLTKEKLEWIAGMESAMGAVEQVTNGSHQALRTHFCAGSCPQAWLEYEWFWWTTMVACGVKAIASICKGTLVSWMTKLPIGRSVIRRCLMLMALLS